MKYTFLPKKSSFFESLDLGTGACCPCLSLSFTAATTSNPGCGGMQRYSYPFEGLKYFLSIPLAGVCQSLMVAYIVFMRGNATFEGPSDAKMSTMGSRLHHLLGLEP